MYRFLDRARPPTTSRRSPPSSTSRCWRRASPRVAEFHYLHHAPGGAPYADPAELAAPHRRRRRRDRHRPHPAAGALQPTAAPARSRSPAASSASAATSTRFLAPARRAPRRRALPADAVLGVAPHSLRAVDAGRSSRRSSPRCPTGPIHIHAAEQVAGGRARSRPGSARGPVDWLLDRRRRRPALVPDPRHPDDRRPRPSALAALRRRRRPLPDHRGEPRRRHLRRPALPRAPAARSASARDSNVRIALAEELRQLEYSQRLRDRARNVLRRPRRLGRRHALRRARSPAAPRRSAAPCGAIRPGRSPTSSRSTPTTSPSPPSPRDQLARRLDLRRRRRRGARGLVRRPPSVTAGRHVARDRIEARYRTTMARLAARL